MKLTLPKEEVFKDVLSSSIAIRKTAQKEFKLVVTNEHIFKKEEMSLFKNGFEAGFVAAIVYIKNNPNTFITKKNKT